MIRKEPSPNKHQIISEYLTGDQTFEALSLKYGVKSRTIQSWVRAFRIKHPAPERSPIQEKEKDIKALKKQLEQTELKNELLEEMLRLSGEHAGIDFRKKFGTR